MNKINDKQYEKLYNIMHKISKRLREMKGDINTMFPNGITSSELSVLKVANKYPDAVLKEISAYLDIPGSTLTSIVDRLEKRQLIKRVISKKNRRSYALELTEKGIKTSELHEEAEKKLYEKLLLSLNENSERDILIDLLEKISKNL